MNLPLPDHLKKLGPDQIRLMISSGKLADTFYMSALEWLAAEDLAASRSNEATNDRVMKTARNANRIAMTALAIAIACMIIQLLHI